MSPGAILPIRELLAEALLDDGKPAEALVEYEAALKIYPKRFNGVAGAAMAAEKAGKAEAARGYYAQLLELSAGGDGKRPEISRAKAYVKRS